MLFRSTTSLSRTLAIGDAMRTDIAGANRQGIDALFVTSGIHRDELHRDGAPLQVAAFAQFADGFRDRPQAVIPSLVW